MKIAIPTVWLGLIGIMPIGVGAELARPDVGVAELARPETAAQQNAKQAVVETSVGAFIIEAPSVFQSA